MKKNKNQNKPTIIAIVGLSGSGKTTLSMYLQDKLCIPAICSYTTRPMRPGEVNGRDHWFMPPNTIIPMFPLAYTLYGGHHYWTQPEQITEELVSYVIDERGLNDLKTYWSDMFNIISVYVNRPNRASISSERKSRDDSREVVNSEYDIVLDNSSDLQTFIKRAIVAIGEYTKK